jgi:hypothetical protein
MSEKLYVAPLMCELLAEQEKKTKLTTASDSAAFSASGSVAGAAAASLAATAASLASKSASRLSAACSRARTCKNDQHCHSFILDQGKVDIQQLPSPRAPQRDPRVRVSCLPFQSVKMNGLELFYSMLRLESGEAEGERRMREF